MKKIVSFILVLFACNIVLAQNPSSNKIDTAGLDLKAFAEKIVSGAPTDFGKANTLLNWLSSSFTWTYTDYVQRSVKDIIARMGGNCFELATVYMALVNELGIKYRPIAEINLQIPSEDRRKGSYEKIKTNGNRMSVFGYQHNDHRWVEVYDQQANDWVPIDPTMNLFGYEQWLKARAWFGSRHTINDAFSSEMIIPIAIFVVDKNNKSNITEDRTQHYVVDKLDQLYDYKLSRLPSWTLWKTKITEINVHAKAAFAGAENLHNYEGTINELRTIYEKLKKEYAATASK